MLTTTSVLRRTAATLSAVGALTALGLVPAAAHDEVLSTSPEQGAVLESAPEQIELSYSGEIMDIGHQVLVTGPEGQSVTEGPLERDGSQVVQPLAETGSEEGTYQVVWRVVSSDGHPIEGTYTYQVGDGADTTTAAPSLSSTPTDAPTDGSDSSAQAQDAAAQEDSGGLSGWAVGATVVVLALAVIGLLGLMSRRRRKS
ncbi:MULTISPECIES: copper resistance CopC family protein [Kocuria]|uniref:copper resistance CopC family protein n=1 Tax=Kocuria TaxID=57493 RepID=UPI0025402988|nr:copper resistance CopC family protein [Kocuria rosea]WIG19267.1 copper resistance protein CopC [Kocuria rosea]